MATDDPDRLDKKIPEPWWTALIYKAEKIGYAGLAAFLVYVGATVLTSDVSAIKAQLALHAADSDEMKGKLTSLVNVTVQQCVNASTTEAKRTACFTALTFAPVRDPR